MLSARLEEEPVDMSNIDQASTSAGGFGKMLNSLQGLQQRLEDFSITDVANAEANAQTLILRLRQFQDTIAAVALLKNAAADVNRSIAEIAQLNGEAGNLDGGENHPQLHAIVKARKLIKLQKVIAALKTGADDGESIEETTGDGVAGALTSVELTANQPNEVLAPTVPESPEVGLARAPKNVDESAAASQALKTDSTTASTTISAPILEPAPDSAVLDFTATDEMPLETQASTDFPTAQAEFETAVAAVVKAPAPAGEAWVEDFPAPAERFAESLVTVDLPIVEHAAKTTPQKNQKSRDNGHGQLDKSTALVPANESFDLRLLDDLVSNYGEFATNPNLPATIKKKQLQNFASAASVSHEPQAKQPRPVETTAAVIKKDGDLDRQLKKIIKDYGEYDLYSDKPTANIKKAGILAFVVLALVFGGIYFFKAPPSTAKTAPAATTESGATENDRKSQASANEAKDDKRKNALGTTEILETPTAKE